MELINITHTVSPNWASNQATITDFRAQLDGQVFLPNDPGYEAARQAWNLKVDQHPAIIVSARTAQDIVATVRFARENQMGVAVQATGHGNVRPADGCLLLLTREMQGVEIDPQAQTARIEAGTRWGPVLAAAQEYGLAPLLGSSPGVGAVGYTLGGGLGWLARKYGLSADHVLQFELVTADGQLRVASKDENPDLFWGLRGGGGSLGIVTRMTVRLFPVSQVYGGNIYYPASMAHEVFQHYRSWISEIPDSMTSSLILMNFPPIPEMPEFLRGQSFVIVRGCCCGPLEEGEALLQYWRGWREPLMDDFRAMPFSEVGLISNDPEDPEPGFNTAAWLRELSDTAIDAIISGALGKDGPSPLIFTEIRHAGGAIRRADPRQSVYGNRQAELLLAFISSAPTPAAHHQLVAYTSALFETLRPDLTGGVYMNFLEGVESQQRIRDGLAPGGYERLQHIKAAVDPDNLLRYSFNVPPAEAAAGKMV